MTVTARNGDPQGNKALWTRLPRRASFWKVSLVALLWLGLVEMLPIPIKVVHSGTWPSNN